ncbi:MAG: ATPase, T2SS/T4P/T4SS family [Opitutaceae bacterium]|nr:ATPase, T2SS/T4P/T4SS family [Opitutaceae bacterium]
MPPSDRPQLDARLRPACTQIPHFPADAFAAGAEPDPWVFFQQHDPAAAAAAFAEVLTRQAVPFAPLDQNSCESGAVMLALETAAGAAEPLDRLLEDYGPVPFATVGHLLVFAHFDPAQALPAYFPRHLCSPLWVSLADYLKLREDFRDRARSLRAGVTPRPLQADPPNGHLATLRSFLAWVVRQPTIDSRERATIEFLLASPDNELQPARLSTALYCSLTAARRKEPVLVPATALRIDRDMLAKIPSRERCSSIGYIPFVLTPGVVLIGAENPEEPRLGDEIARSFPGRARHVFPAPVDGIRFLLTLTDAHAGAVKAASGAQEEDLSNTLFKLNPSDWAGKNPRAYGKNLPSLLQLLLSEAVTARASDIHVDVFHRMTRIRYVIDGDAEIFHSLPREYASQLANHLYDQVCKKSQESDAPTAPKEGSFSFAYMGRPVMVRVAMAYANGKKEEPKIVLRLLDRSAGVRDLSLLNLHREEVEIIKRYLLQPHGIVIVSGPTGSGKSTTLMTCMQDINDPKRIIYSLEDPVEYIIPGVTQIAVASQKSERTRERVAFAEGLRLLLRMDPDVIMVGEIRDLQTANAAIEASNTGHLILTTLHANSAPDIIKRLLSMKDQDEEVDRANLGENIRLLTAQRLVKRLCNCYKRVPLAEADRALFTRHGVEPPAYVGVPAGCPRCRGKGYFGRTVVMELLPVTQEISDLISEGARTCEIRKAAERAGYITLAKSACWRVASEQTSLQAVQAKIAL